MMWLLKLDILHSLGTLIMLCFLCERKACAYRDLAEDEYKRSRPTVPLKHNTQRKYLQILWSESGVMWYADEHVQCGKN